MSLNTRYYFIKKIYPNHLAFFQTNKNSLGYKCFGLDKHIYKYLIHFGYDIYLYIEYLKSEHISFLLMDFESNIVYINTENDNKYSELLYKSIVLDILDRIRVCV